MTLQPAQKAVLVFALATALVMPAMAYASSYYSSLSLTTSLTGATRSYSGSNLSIYMTTKADASPNPTFRVELHRDKLFGNDYIGYANFPRNGSRTATWSSVGSGNYYFYFSKATDGVTVTSSNVHMYN